jgi:4-diphosphocytidyl-2-C-methyl-D-erythritol kinase
MIRFPNAKINLGLNVVNKRPDGYHNIETVFYPIGLKDVLEIVHLRNSVESYSWNNSGMSIDAPAEENICIKALKLVKREFDLDPIQVQLHKVIPFGAGLGGGSADGANMLLLLNDFFELDLAKSRLHELALQLGADCPFFIENTPHLATGIGEVLEPISIDLSGYHLLLVVPFIHVSTPEAYRYVQPQVPELSLKAVIQQPVDTWKEQLANSFETSVFKQYPGIRDIKNKLYESGAVYASMSGSGSSVFGLFHHAPDLHFEDAFVWKETL